MLRCHGVLQTTTMTTDASEQKILDPYTMCRRASNNDDDNMQHLMHHVSVMRRTNC